MGGLAIENLRSFDPAGLFLDPATLGSFAIDKSVYDQVDKTLKFFIELEDLGYKLSLTPTEVGDIDGRKSKFVKRINEFADFKRDITTHGTPGDFVKTWSSGMVSLTDEIQRLFRTSLIFLRQQAAPKDVADAIQSALEAQTRYGELSRLSEDLNKKLSSKIEELGQKENEVVSGHGKLGAAQLAVHFAKQASEAHIEANKWNHYRQFAFWTLLVLIVSFFIVALVKPTKFDLDYWTHYGFLKLAFVSLMTYAINFFGKNFKVHKNLELINLHRANVGNTLREFLDAGPDEGARSEFLKQGTEAMFKNIPNGMIGKNDPGDKGPFIDIYNSIPGFKG